MSLLEPPRCPQCNSAIALRDFWEVAPKQGRGTGLSGALGIVCPTCGVKLRVLQGRAQLSYVLVFGVPFALLFLVGQAIPLNTGTPSAKIALLCLGATYFGGFILQQHYFPRLLQLRYLRDGEVVDYPLARAAKEQAAEAQFFEETRELQSPDTGKPAWKCASCGEEIRGILRFVGNVGRSGRMPAADRAYPASEVGQTRTFGD
jgi:hypothetical protein